jgi:hypothetical protein
MITVNFETKIVSSTASIPDILAFKNTIRDIEEDDEGRQFPHIIDFVKIDIG